MNSKRIVVTAALLGLTSTFGAAGMLAAEDASSSSECINCHTDLDRMDEYGAASSGESAGIAG